jgi:hypothetical protein
MPAWPRGEGVRGAMAQGSWREPVHALLPLLAACSGLSQGRGPGRATTLAGAAVGGAAHGHKGGVSVTTTRLSFNPMTGPPPFARLGTRDTRRGGPGTHVECSQRQAPPTAWARCQGLRRWGSRKGEVPLRWREPPAAAPATASAAPAHSWAHWAADTREERDGQGVGGVGRGWLPP